jgi:hypothetical protein
VETIDPVGLRAAYPQWHIRFTLSGTRIATRMDKCDLSVAEMRAGLVMTLMHDTWADLADALAHQAENEKKLAETAS